MKRVCGNGPISRIINSRWISRNSCELGILIETSFNAFFGCDLSHLVDCFRIKRGCKKGDQEELLVVSSGGPGGQLTVRRFLINSMADKLFIQLGVLRCDWCITWFSMSNCCLECVFVFQLVCLVCSIRNWSDKNVIRCVSWCLSVG